MKVTSVKIDKYNPKEVGTCAECSIILDDSLCIHKILVIVGEKGEFIAFPNMGIIKSSKRNKRYLDIIHPINKSLTDDITAEVLKAYHNYS